MRKNRRQSNLFLLSWFFTSSSGHHSIFLLFCIHFKIHFSIQIVNLKDNWRKQFKWQKQSQWSTVASILWSMYLLEKNLGHIFTPFSESMSHPTFAKNVQVFIVKSWKESVPHSHNPLQNTTSLLDCKNTPEHKEILHHLLCLKECLTLFKIFMWTTTENCMTPTLVGSLLPGITAFFIAKPSNSMSCPGNINCIARSHQDLNLPQTNMIMLFLQKSVRWDLLREEYNIEKSKG